MLRCVAGFIQFGRLPPAQVGPVALEPAFSRPHPGVSAEETPRLCSLFPGSRFTPGLRGPASPVASWESVHER